MRDVLALDIGGSAIKYARIDAEHNIQELDQVPAPRASEQEFVEAVRSIYNQYKGRVDGIGISMGGKVDPENGRIVSSGQFPFLRGKSLVELLSTCCPVKITVQNDGHCAALAELNYGCLKDIEYGLVIVLGTGIGSAIIMKRKIYEGHRFCSGELSLIRVNGEADLKNSWMFRGGGATGLINLVKEALGTDQELNGMEIFDLAEKKDETVLRAIDEYCRITAVQIYNLQAILDVERIAIGGGISARQILIDGIRKYVADIFAAEAAYGLSVSRPEIVPCTFYNEANLLGAWHDFISRRDR